MDHELELIIPGPEHIWKTDCYIFSYPGNTRNLTFYMFSYLGNIGNSSLQHSIILEIRRIMENVGDFKFQYFQDRRTYKKHISNMSRI